MFYIQEKLDVYVLLNARKYGRPCFTSEKTGRPCFTKMYKNMDVRKTQTSIFYEI